MKEPELAAAGADRRGYYVLFFVIAIAGCTIDLLTKYWVFQWRGMPREGASPWWLWEGYVGVETTLNRGALFGWWQGGTPWFATFSVAAVCGVLFWVFRRGAVYDRLLTVALGCVTGGVLGNLYDRLGLWRHPDALEQWRYAVRDWILLRYGSRTWPNFNIADSLLVCGAILLMWHALSNPPVQAAEAATDTPSAN